MIWVTFDKVKDCHYLGMDWYKDGIRVALILEPEPETLAKSRPVGEQATGPWLLKDVMDLEGVVGYSQHRCHPLWVTRTTLYP